MSKWEDYSESDRARALGVAHGIGRTGNTAEQAVALGGLAHMGFFNGAIAFFIGFFVIGLFSLLILDAVATIPQCVSAMFATGHTGQLGIFVLGGILVNLLSHFVPSSRIGPAIWLLLCNLVWSLISIASLHAFFRPFVIFLPYFALTTAFFGLVATFVFSELKHLRVLGLVLFMIGASITIYGLSVIICDKIDAPHLFRIFDRYGAYDMSDLAEIKQAAFGARNIRLGAFVEKLLGVSNWIKAAVGAVIAVAGFVVFGISYGD